MIKIASLSVAGALLAFGLSAAPAEAQTSQTFVSGKGTNRGTCARAAPCKTFAFAIGQTAAGGEIDVLDPADYGPVTITKAISIVNDGVGVAGIIQAGSGLNGVTINAGASDSVHLRGLTIAGLGSGSSGSSGIRFNTGGNLAIPPAPLGNDGIRFNSGGNLAIENCVVRNFSVGIFISPSTSSSFSVSNTIASNNGGFGIFVQPTGSAVVKGVLGKVTANNNSTGIFVDGLRTTGASLDVTIADSEASNNSDAGVAAGSTPATTAPAVMVRNVVASYNNTGLSASNAILRVAHSVVTGNLFGVPGSIQSYGDNDIDGNKFDNVTLVIPTH